MVPRRRFLGIAAASPLLSLAGCEPRARVIADDGMFPEKAADLLLRTDRPPNLETPLHYLGEELTPNAAFFVRWHLADIPEAIDLGEYRLQVQGAVERPLELSLAELKAMGKTSIVAVNQCSGNGRALFEPRVPGVQWQNGAVGCARWEGVPLQAVLARAGVRTDAVEVVFGGMDRGLGSVPDFEKSLPMAEAMRPEVLLAWGMNGAPLPWLNGFPLRLVVPGLYSTYWVKALDRITIVEEPFAGYWMDKAYRIPRDGASESPDQLAPTTEPIGKLNLRGILARPAPASVLPRDQVCRLEGVAFDGGSGIAKVAVSCDGGETFVSARLGPDRGRFAFRRFSLDWRPRHRGPTRLMVQATSKAGEQQPLQPSWNRSGYMRNVVEATEVEVT